MIKRVKIVGAKPRRVQITDKPKRRIEPRALAASLGASPDGECVGAKVDLISLAEIGTAKQHSSGT